MSLRIYSMALKGLAIVIRRLQRIKSSIITSFLLSKNFCATVDNYSL